MADWLTRSRGYILLTLVFAVVLGATVFALRRPEPKPLTIITPAPRPSATPATLIVQVGGAVLNPGVVRLSEGARVEDALKAVGGAIGNADLSRLNLARHVNDGELIYVPQVGEPTPTVAAGGVRASPTPTGDKININTASADELDRLPGIGPTLAQRIIEYRQANGPFERVEDVMKVRGIGPSQFEGIKNLIVVR